MFNIDAMSRIPVYEQIINQTENYILRGILSAGSKMPSVRSLSLQLSINPNTIQKSYSELDRRGIIYSVPGKGCFVSEEAKNILSENMKGKLSDLKHLVYELKLANVSKESIIECIEEMYDNHK